MSVKVGIIMGSDSDLPVMSKAAEILDELQVPYELTIVSAHRTPDRLCEYAKTAEEKGLSVIIAGAGGAAHLPGMTAAMTVLPVIGVPVQTKALGGVDSLYSIVQMPPLEPKMSSSLFTFLCQFFCFIQCFLAAFDNRIGGTGCSCNCINAFRHTFFCNLCHHTHIL